MTAREAAARYVDHGFRPVPILPGGKKPVIEEWPDRDFTPDDFEANSNVGWKLGDERGTSDIDMDCEEAIAAGDVLLPQTGARFGRTSKPRSHAVYFCDPAVRTKQFKDPTNGKMLVELRGRSSTGKIGNQTVVPPSIHESGEKVRFEKGCNGWPAQIEGEVLQRVAGEIAAASLLARHMPTAGSRHDFFLALAGVLSRADWSMERAIRFHEAIYECLWPGEVDHSALQSEVGTTFDKRDTDTPTTGTPSLLGMVDAKVLSKAFEWLGIKTTTGTTTTAAEPEPWPEPEELWAELPPVDAFDGRMLPDAFRAQVMDVSERMQVPPDYAAVIAMLSLAGAVNRRAVMQPKRLDSTWRVVGNLWGGIVAPPGYLKTPVIQDGTRPLVRIQALWRNEHAAATSDYEREKRDYDLRMRAWESMYQASLKDSKKLPAFDQPQCPEQPISRRLIVNDATAEALHEIQNANPAGVMVVRDELTGWWAQLDRAGREGERAFYLECWDGNSSFTVDRIGRGTIHVEHCCLSMVGGIQPARLRPYLVDAITNGPGNDGLIQRFQLLVWPDTSPEWKYVDRLPDPGAEHRMATIFDRMVGIDPEDPLRLQFAPDAQELFEDWMGRLEAKVRRGGLHPALISHLSKYRGLMPRLAMLCELADKTDSATGVSIDSAVRAAEWCRYLESHAIRIYSCISTRQLQSARELAEKIRRGEVGKDGSFTPKSVYVNGWTALGTPEEVKAAIEVLEEHGWIRGGTAKSSDPQGRGRPSMRYEINPKVVRRGN